jgi:hypothetical protein
MDMSEDTDTPTAPHGSPSCEHNMQYTTSTTALQDITPPTADSDEPVSLLLDLPPEIRTMTWDYALTSPTPIRITDQLKQPALVQVNRQIRFETRKLALVNNNYRIDIVACDACLFAKFFQLWHHIVNADKTVKKFALPIRIGLLGDCHWLNLVRWRRLVSKGKCGALRIGAAARGRSKIVEAATGLAANADSWEEVKRGLEAWRSVAGMDDKQWLLDLEVAK